MNIKNLNVFKTIIRIPTVRVFTKEYKEETKYYECLQSNISKMKLKSNNNNANQRIKILK